MKRRKELVVDAWCLMPDVLVNHDGQCRVDMSQGVRCGSASVDVARCSRRWCSFVVAASHLAETVNGSQFLNHQDL